MSPELEEENVSAEREMKVDPNLMTEKEIEEKANEMRKTIVGSVLPILKAERFRFGLMFAIFSISSFSYTFLRLFKDVVIHTVFEPAAQNWLKIFTFIASLLLVALIQKLLAKRNIDAVFGIMSILFAVSILAVGLLMRFRYLIQKEDGWAQEFFVADTATTRGIASCYILFLLFNHITYAFFYISCEVFGSMMLSFLCLTYFNSHCTPDQNKRFVRVLYIGSNVLGFIASELYRLWNERIKESPYADKQKYFLIFPCIVSALYVVIFVLKKFLDVEFSKPILVSSGTVSKKPAKKSVSIMEGIYLAFTSKLLMAMSAMSLFYSMSQVLLSTLTSSSYSAASSFLEKDKASLANKYKSYDTEFSALAVLVIMLTPFARLFEFFGIASAGGIPIFIAFVGAFVSCLIACINYPALGDTNMWIASYFNDSKCLPLLECWANVIVSLMMKVAKYAFFDLVKEAISMKISPVDRAICKGVFDGICIKLGKALGAIYGIVMEYFTTRRDCRYYAPVTFALVLLFCLLWIKALGYMHRKYSKVAKLRDTFLSLDYLEGYENFASGA